MVEKKSWKHLYENVERKFDKVITLEAEVIHGFKRGSTELGFPTANLSMIDLGEKGSILETGIYYGIAFLNSQEYKTVISVGWNPFYKNVEKTVEAYLLHKFEEDFYGSQIKLVIYGYLRPEANFDSVGELVDKFFLCWSLLELYTFRCSVLKISVAFVD